MRDEIAAEQVRLDRLYARLDELKQQQVTRGARLAAAEDKLCFGRVGDTAVGRITLMRGDDALLVDWRAPKARPFYDGTSPRLLLKTHGRTVIAVDSGPSFDADRTGRMPDIVATIQAEQDAIIRSDPGGVLVVQGGPGTGKTVVALHRAAYLLFHRPGLDVLVVAPNAILLSYIDQVLPGLGETAVSLTTLTGNVRSEDEPPVRRIKADLRMAAVLAGVVRDIQDAIPYPEAVAKARAEPHNRARALYTQAVADLLAAERQALEDQFEADVADTLAEAGIDAAVAADLRELGLAETEEHDQDHDFVRRAVEAWWPVLSPERVVETFYADPHRYAGSRLDRADCDLLARAPGQPWTTSDVPLLDEAAELVNADQKAYGHIVVDEAQELTPMAWRMIFRRCPSRSLTIAGDVAQTADPDGATTWADVLRPHIGDRWRAARLSVNYRTPAEIMDAAAELLPAADRPRSVRAAGVPPWRRTLTEPEPEPELAAVVAEEARRGGMVAVITADDRVSDVARMIGTRAFGPDVDLTEQVVVLGVGQIKGLEFDSVVIAGPAGILAGPRGRNALYVAMTRATRRLGLVEISRPSAPTSAVAPPRGRRSATSPDGTGHG